MLEDLDDLERETGLEPAAFSLEGCCAPIAPPTQILATIAIIEDMVLFPQDDVKVDFQSPKT